VTRPGDARRPGETQPERTALSWQRTGLGIMAIAGLLGLRALEFENPVLLGVAGVTALGGLGVLGGLAPVRYRQVRRTLAAHGTGAPAPGLLAVTTAASVLAALAALAGVLILR
jgi:putative membrane protein